MEQEQGQVQSQDQITSTKTKKSKKKELLRFRGKCCRNCKFIDMDAGYVCEKDYAHVSPSLTCKEFEFVYMEDNIFDIQLTQQQAEQAQKNLDTF